jgi:hypothetical protein
VTVNATTLKRLAALQLAPDAMQEVLSIIASCIEPLEERRRRDRDRKRGKSPDIPQNVRGNSSDIPAEIPPVHILPPKEDSSKAKKPSRSTSTFEVPDRPTEKAINFAVSHGWELPKIQSEWQRFRDHSLAKGKRHRDVDAAWRNWVTSPYQNGALNGQPTLQNRTAQAPRSGATGQDAILAGMGRLADRIRARGDAERREREASDDGGAAAGNDARLI